MDTLRRVWAVGRWVVAGLVLVVIMRRVVAILQAAPGSHNIPYERWYGSWREVLIASAIFLVFVLGFTWPRHRGEWRNAGLYSAFLISLFTEMFGVPLTIYLLAPLLGVPAWSFGMNESHLWAFALDRLGLLPLAHGVHLVMVVSLALIAAALGLLVVGWATVYRGRAQLVTSGIYRCLRHPQYLGLIFLIVAFNVMWPTLLTLLMAPVLIVMYVRLARREDEELATVFGEAFLEYAARTPAFIPLGRSRAAWALGAHTRASRGRETPAEREQA